MQSENPYVHLAIKDGILIGTYKKNIRINLAAAKSIVTARKLFTEGVAMPTMIISSGVVSIDKPAREYLSSAEGTAGITASAIVVNSVFASFLGNFFLAVTARRMPVKVFASRQRAERWLRRFVV